jgi:hypothetical protein
LARQFVDAYPPQYSTLVGYGKEFPEFLLRQESLHGLSYLHDLAALDAAWLVAYFAADVVPLTTSELELMASNNQDVTTMRLRLVPSASLVRLDNAVCEVWGLLKQQDRLDSAIEIQPLAGYGFVWRDHGRVHIHTLSPGEAQFLFGIKQGLMLGDAAQKGLDIDPDFDIAQVFGNLIDSHILHNRLT